MLRPRRINAAADSSNEDGRRSQAAQQYYRMSWYSVSLVLGCFILFALLMVGITLSLTLASPEARYVPPTMESSVQTTTAVTATTGVSTVTTTAGTTTTAPPTTTTVPATFAPLAITCPPSITLTLGTNLNVPYTGPNANASGGCGSGPIIIQYVDGVSSSLPGKRLGSRLPSLPSRLWRDGSSSTPRSTFIQGHSMTETSIMVSCDKVPTLIDISNKRNTLYNRSPSFSAGNLLVQGTPLTYPLITTENITSDAVVSASSNHVVMFNQQGYALVLNKTTTALMGTFSVEALSPPGSICSATATNNTFTENQLVWDQAAQQWVFFRVVVQGDVNKTRGLCIHVSSANETNPMLSTYTTYHYNANITARLQVGLWTRVYALSFINQQQNVSTLCVLNRLQIATPLPNVTASMFCATSYDNNAPHLWSPVDAQSGPLPPLGMSENSNSPNVQNPGAVFMRSVDDEFYSGANSPTIDRIEVEHWYNINFTTSTYNTLRYPVLTRDFDESMSNCTGNPIGLPGLPGFVCITTPAAQKLNIVRGAVKFNYRAHSGNQQSIVTSLNSHSGKSIYWFEMRWQKPNLATPERWDLVQDQGITASSAALDFKFAPIIQMDVNGTILLAYTKSSNITYPSLYMTSRLANDPVGFVRNETLLSAGSFGSLFTSGNEWQSTGSIAIDPEGSRTFFVSGAISAMPPQSCNLKVARVRVLGEVIQRVWSATDGCNANVTCVQVITTL